MRESGLRPCGLWREGWEEADTQELDIQTSTTADIQPHTHGHTRRQREAGEGKKKQHYTSTECKICRFHSFHFFPIPIHLPTQRIQPHPLPHVRHQHRPFLNGLGLLGERLDIPPLAFRSRDRQVHHHPPTHPPHRRVLPFQEEEEGEVDEHLKDVMGTDPPPEGPVVVGLWE